jgi:hypothetical protein
VERETRLAVQDHIRDSGGQYSCQRDVAARADLFEADPDVVVRIGNGVAVTGRDITSEVEEQRSDHDDVTLGVHRRISRAGIRRPGGRRSRTDIAVIGRSDRASGRWDQNGDNADQKCRDHCCKCSNESRPMALCPLGGRVVGAH